MLYKTVGFVAAISWLLFGALISMGTITPFPLFERRLSKTKSWIYVFEASIIAFFLLIRRRGGESGWTCESFVRRPPELVLSHSISVGPIHRGCSYRIARVRGICPLLSLFREVGFRVGDTDRL